MEIKITNDGKGRHDSFEASACVDVLENNGDGMYLIRIELTGWGDTEAKARESFGAMMKACQRKLAERGYAS